MKPRNGAIGVILNRKKNTVLLIKRRDVPVWVLPGGGIELNETPSQAVCREFFEETGYKVKVLREIAEYYYTTKNKTNYIFECQIISGSAQTGSETKESHFFDVSNFPELRDPMIDEWINLATLPGKNVIKKEVGDISKAYLLKHFIRHPLVVTRYFLIKLGIRINT